MPRVKAVFIKGENKLNMEDKVKAAKDINEGANIVFDYELQKEWDLNSFDIPKLIFGIVGTEENGKMKFGWFSPNNSKNILLCFSQDGNRTFQIAISKDCFKEGSIYFDSTTGVYATTPKGASKEWIEAKESLLGYGGFPYKFAKRYDAEGNLDLFKDMQIIDDKFHLKYKDQLAYTFGLEFETCCGYIPQERCFQTGLIPLRDGSIAGLEYATVVMDKNTGPTLIKAQLDELAKRTDINKECSLHMHFGGYPVEPRAILRLWNLLYQMQDLLSPYLPTDVFQTSVWKRSGKDYCKRLEKRYNSIEGLYKWLSMGEDYLGSLAQPHPFDTQRTSKWNVKTRYYWVNFIGMCFYNTAKTVEFRMLAPTFNFNKVIGWLYIFNAILLYAERAQGVYCQVKNLRTLLESVYPKGLSETLLVFLGDCKVLKEAQLEVGDNCGKLHYLDEVVFDGDYDF